MQKIRENAMAFVFLLAACASIFAVILICLFLFVNGVPAMGEIGFKEFIFGKEWSPVDTPPVFGVFPMILGSLYVTAGAIVLGVPVGILSAIFIAKVCHKRLYRMIKPGIDLLAGIPSVVYGFFGMALVVPLIRKFYGGAGSSILAASILLAVMILPTVINISESAIRAVPVGYYDGALALGASHYRSVFFSVVPAAKSGILASVILGVGRAIGETMAVIMVAGNQARMPTSLFKGARTLTANIVIEMGYAAELHREALIATGVVLFVFILLTNLCFAALVKKGDK